MDAIQADISPIVVDGGRTQASTYAWHTSFKTALAKHGLLPYILEETPPPPTDAADDRAPLVRDLILAGVAPVMPQLVRLGYDAADAAWANPCKLFKLVGAALDIGDDEHEGRRAMRLYQQLRPHHAETIRRFVQSFEDAYDYWSACGGGMPEQARIWDCLNRLDDTDPDWEATLAKRAGDRDGPSLASWADMQQWPAFAEALSARFGDLPLPLAQTAGRAGDKDEETPAKTTKTKTRKGRGKRRNRGKGRAKDAAAFDALEETGSIADNTVVGTVGDDGGGDADSKEPAAPASPTDVAAAAVASAPHEDDGVEEAAECREEARQAEPEGLADWPQREAGHTTTAEGMTWAEEVDIAAEAERAAEPAAADASASTTALETAPASAPAKTKRRKRTKRRKAGPAAAMNDEPSAPPPPAASVPPPTPPPPPPPAAANPDANGGGGVKLAPEDAAATGLPPLPRTRHHTWASMSSMSTAASEASVPVFARRRTEDAADAKKSKTAARRAARRARAKAKARAEKAEKAEKAAAGEEAAAAPAAEDAQQTDKDAATQTPPEAETAAAAAAPPCLADGLQSLDPAFEDSHGHENTASADGNANGITSSGTGKKKRSRARRFRGKKPPADAAERMD